MEFSVEGRLRYESVAMFSRQRKRVDVRCPNCGDETYQMNLYYTYRNPLNNTWGCNMILEKTHCFICRLDVILWGRCPETGVYERHYTYDYVENLYKRIGGEEQPILK